MTVILAVVGVANNALYIGIGGTFVQQFPLLYQGLIDPKVSN